MQNPVVSVSVMKKSRAPSKVFNLLVLMLLGNVYSNIEVKKAFSETNCLFWTRAALENNPYNSFHFTVFSTKVKCSAHFQTH